MSEFRFDEDQVFNQYTSPEAPRSKMSMLTNVFIKYSGGLIKSELQAKFVMVLIIILSWVVIVYLWNDGPKPPPIPIEKELEKIR